jgi:hydroxymethylpyrimidine pyrophosphatase-like HAD family hydrolase
MPSPNYDILALDLDGTLFGPTGEVSSRNREAVRRAREAGIEVVICTGRGFKESGKAIRAIDAGEVAAGRTVAPMVTSGGAMIVDAATGETMHRWPVDPGIVSEVCGLFAEMGRAPMLLKDAGAAGFDYLVVTTGPLEPPSQWWFSVMPVEVRFVRSLDEDAHPEHTVRVGFAADRATMIGLASRVRERFEDHVLIHSFPAVAGSSTDSDAGVKDDSIHILEIFDVSVSKWTAIHRLASQQGVPRERIAAIGDEINDVAMIEGAGLGIAMGNAIPEVKAAAKKETADFSQDGVAEAIDRILEGAW